MYRFWAPVIGPLLEALDPDVVVEIGSDQGLNTRNLVEYCIRHRSLLHVIDPLPKYDVDEWLSQYSPNLVFHRTTSEEALESIGHPDVVLIDGDHNWHTVISELRLLEKTAEGESFPLVLLHDVGWPYGRRDLYYEPDRIPAPERQPFRKEGMRPGRTDLDPGGGLNAHLSNAVNEGGPRNGVLTAVEDFMAETSLDLELTLVPGINSLGILYPNDLRDRVREADRLIEELRNANSLRLVLERVEAMRLESQIDASDAQRRLTEVRAELKQAHTRHLESDRQLKDATGDREKLRAQRDEARDRESSLRSQVASLEGAIRSEESESSALRERVVEERARRKKLTKDLASTKQKLRTSERDYRRLRSRRSVRLSLALASLLRPLFRWVRKLKRGSAVLSTEPGPMSVEATTTRRLPAAAQTRLAGTLARQRPGSARTEGPLVSIIVLTRDGAHHLRRLLPSLDETTSYRSFELIIVDNASSDDTQDVLREKRGYPLTVIRNERNMSFSEGNNHASRQAKGELLLFLNNDIEPINPGWLGALVDAVTERDGTVAAGAELVYPIRGVAAKDLTVQHSGISFTFREGAVHPVNIKELDPLDPKLEGLRTFPAATAAVLLVRADAFNSVGGFDEGYVYGTEDVDLCLRLGPLGEIVVTGQAVLFHHESATQKATMAEEMTRMNRLRNHQRFAEFWGPRLSRTVQQERFGADDLFRLNDQRKVAITLTHDDEERGWGDYYTAHGLGDAFEAEGWDVVYAERFEDHWRQMPDDVDLVISLLDSYDVRDAPQGAFTVAWVRNWVDRWVGQPWFDSFDMVVTSSHLASSLIAERSRFVPPVIAMATDAGRFSPGPVNPTFQSDYVFTGNNWGAGRSIIEKLDIHPGEEFLSFGRGWENDPRMIRYWRGHLAHELLPDVYRSTKIVLDDTAGPTLPYGFLNGRVFDALASGALVLTDNVAGSMEMFDGLLPTYSTPTELREQLDRYLGNDDDRETLVGELRRRVIEEHTYAVRPRAFLDAARTRLDRPRVAIKIGVPNEEVKETWGDTHFAGGLAAALTGLGMPTTVHLLPEWDSPASQAVDMVIHLRGLSNYVPKPSHVNVLWIISHPDDVTVRECEKYDIVLVASESVAENLASQTEVPVMFMPQATDHRRFHPNQVVSDLATEVLFLGNSRGQVRPAVDWAIQERLPLTVYGSGWQGRIPPRYLAGEYFPNEDLASLYASATVVLNDHWPDMRDQGFVSNRVFDALASGSVVLSDTAPGLEEIFGDIVPTFSSPGELRSQVERLLSDPGEREERATRGVKLVLSEHTFERRAESIIDLVAPLLEGRISNMAGDAFGPIEGAR